MSAISVNDEALIRLYVELNNEYENKKDDIYRFKLSDSMYQCEYYNPETGYDLKISNWELDKKTTNQFFEFINEEYARCMLEHLPISIEFENFIIQRV